MLNPTPNLSFPPNSPNSKLLFALYCFLFWRRQWHPTPVLLPGKFHGWRSLEGCSPWGCWGSDMTERLHFHFSFSCIEEGNGNPLQCSCLENPRDRGAWWAAVYGVVQSWTQLKRLSSSSSSSIVFRVRYWNIQLWMLISPFLFFLQVRQLLLAVFWGSLFRYWVSQSKITWAIYCLLNSFQIFQIATFVFQLLEFPSMISNSLSA